MIVDELKNLARYVALNPLFADAAEYLSGLDLSALSDGRLEVDGERIFASAMVDRALKQPADAALEAHDRYIDIQVVARGVETFGWSDRAACVQPRGAMDEARDILFFDDRPANHISLSAGQAVIFFPWDAHAPLIGEGTVTKLVVKVMV
ncbi:MAG: YhcH/YjgK/YiaL family protein [Rikenellaceae bacterium]|jgi:YhcH/YjgK/YiaL family protein|nr:YhcH/YjgK/YiaL family protein [Rikenellaceae bacterium]